MEMVPAPVAAEVTKALRIPTIGIGAGIDCDAQVLVWQDMMGLRTGKAPRFVKRYADLHGVMLDAAKAYADDVANGSFPAAGAQLRELTLRWEWRFGRESPQDPRPKRHSRRGYGLQSHTVAPNQASPAHRASPATGTAIVSRGRVRAHRATSHT